MSMTDYFFSVNHSDCKKYFEGLDIWKEEKFRELQGTYPVIFISFADVKQNNLQILKEQLMRKPEWGLSIRLQSCMQTLNF